MRLFYTTNVNQSLINYLLFFSNLLSKKKSAFTIEKKKRYRSKFKFYRIQFRYLAIVGALAAEADYVFFPECPPPVDWPEKLCKKLEQACQIIFNRNIQSCFFENFSLLFYFFQYYFLSCFPSVLSRLKLIKRKFLYCCPSLILSV